MVKGVCFPGLAPSLFLSESAARVVEKVLLLIGSKITGFYRNKNEIRLENAGIYCLFEFSSFFFTFIVL